MELEFITITSWSILALIGLSKIFFSKREYTITAIFSFVIMAIGFQIVINHEDLSNLAFGIANLAAGAYFLLRGGIEHWKGKNWQTPDFIINWREKRREKKFINLAEENKNV